MREPVPDPSSPGSVVLDLGPGVGALVLHTPPELNGREIEVSAAGESPGHRTHSQVRARDIGGHIQYAAVYPQLAIGSYTVWQDADTPAATVAIHSGQVTTAWWPGQSRGTGPAGQPAG